MNPFGSKARQSAAMRSGRRTKKEGKKSADKSGEFPAIVQHGDVNVNTETLDHVDIKHIRDTRNCCITGMIVVRSGDLVMIDSLNYCLKVVDVETFRIKSRTDIRYKPWDLSEFENGHVVVTCPVNKKLLFLTLENGNNYHQLLLGGVCYGVLVHHSTFIVSFTYPNPEVQFLSRDGHRLKTVNIYSTGLPLFKCPRYLTMAADGNSFYVSDCGNDTVVKVSLTGGIEGMYDHRQVRNPRGVVTQGQSSMFVCGWGSNNISHASSACVHKEIVLQGCDGLYLPQSMASRPRSAGTELYVSHDGAKQNILSIFRLNISQE